MTSTIVTFVTNGLHIAKHVCHTGAVVHRVMSIVERRTEKEAVEAIQRSLRTPAKVMTAEQFRLAHGTWRA